MLLRRCTFRLKQPSQAVHSHRRMRNRWPELYDNLAPDSKKVAFVHGMADLGRLRSIHTLHMIFYFVHTLGAVPVEIEILDEEEDEPPPLALHYEGGEIEWINGSDESDDMEQSD